MKDIIFDDFQNSVNECFLRHRSIIDILSKVQSSQARINRAVAKAVTDCGCISIDATSNKENLDSSLNNDEELKLLNKCLDTHLKGKLCDNCREIVQHEIGNNLFYLTSLCNLLDLNMYDILLKENNNIKTLGKYTLK